MLAAIVLVTAIARLRLDRLAASAHGGSMNLGDLALNAAVVALPAGAAGMTLDEPPCGS